MCVRAGGPNPPQPHNAPVCGVAWRKAEGDGTCGMDSHATTAVAFCGNIWWSKGGERENKDTSEGKHHLTSPLPLSALLPLHPLSHTHRKTYLPGTWSIKKIIAGQSSPPLTT